MLGEIWCVFSMVDAPSDTVCVQVVSLLRYQGRRWCSDTVGGNPFDALIFGYYEADRLLYAARTRNGFTPAVRAQLFKKFRALEVKACPFANLPEPKGGRWGAGLTAKKMADCRWLRPTLVGQFEFVEWTPDNHLRHAKFIALREDKPAWEVRRE